jgi:hypothetical protein
MLHSLGFEQHRSHRAALMMLIFSLTNCITN